MRRLYIVVVCFLITLPLFRCQKELSFDKGISFFESGPKSFEGVLQGNVIDENNEPAIGVAINIGSKTAITDVYGYFRITEAPLEKEASMVTAEKPGYFKSYRTFNATPGANYIKIKLIKKELTGKINSSTGGEVKLTNESSIVLPANAVIQADNGSDYSGEINIYASYINPTSADINTIIPGSFRAKDKNGKIKLLASYGMFAVQLESNTGQKLQIKPGTKASLSTAIPSALQSSAPATISLWYVDEQSGIWKEEGSAVKKGNVYVGEVAHFSFWNCDVPMDAVNLSATFKTNTGLPLVYATIKITAKNEGNIDSAGFATSTYGYTDSLGQVSGLVPANNSLMLDVLDQCSNSIYSKNLGSLNENTDLGIITVTNSGSAMVTLKGSLSNCSGNPVSNGYAVIRYDNYNYRYVAVNSKGNFEFTLIRCAGSPIDYSVFGVDEAAHQQGAIVNDRIQTPVTDIGDIAACGSSTLQYISYNLDNVNYKITNDQPRDSIFGAYTFEAGNSLFTTDIYGRDTDSYISFRFNSAATAGTYSVDTFFVVAGLPGARIVPPFNVTITKFPLQSQDFFEGSFSGNLKDEEGKIHAISGSFKIRRF